MGYAFSAVLIWLSVVFISIAALVTHIVMCIKTASWILLLFGMCMPPIGVIHGIMVWLGAW
jgi:hypothetical protein